MLLPSRQPYLLLTLGGIFFVLARYLFGENRKSNDTEVFQRILFLYGFWILFSSTMHYIALSTLDSLAYITVKRQNASWGLQMVGYFTPIYYLLFPLLLSVTINYFKAHNDSHRKLYLLPVMMIASLIIALYQGLVDMKFLNNPVFASDNRVSGLCGDANGLGISLFLLFPLCFLAILNIREFWKKLFFGLLSVTLLWCLALSGSRSGLFGIILFLVFLPLILIYGNPDRFKGWYKVMILSSTIFTLLLISIGLVAFERGFSPSTRLMKRMNTTYFDIKEGGIGSPLKSTGRLELWRQAFRLTILSPLAGWGPGGFYRNLDNIRFRNGENSILFDNADNYYLQMSSDLGILGASFNLFLHFMPLWMVFRIRKKIQDQEEKLAIRICFAIVSIMMVLFVVMPNTIGITPMFILVILLAFLFVTALKYGYSFEKVNIKNLGISLALLTILFILGTYDTTFGKNGYTSMRQAPWWPLRYIENCYGIEEWGEDVVRWFKKDAFLRIRLFNPLPQKIKLIFMASHPDIQSKPLTVKFGGKAGVKYEVVVKDNSWKMVEIPITSENVYEFTGPNKSVTKYLILSLDVSRTWIPKEWGVSQDTRELGVLISVSNLWRALYRD